MSSVLTFSPFGRLESKQRLSASGKLLERWELRDAAEIHDQYSSHGHVRTTILGLDGGLDLIERTEFVDGKPRTSTRRVRRKDALSTATCERPAPPAGWETALADLSWLTSQVEAAGGDAVRIGGPQANLLAENCADYPGGTAALAQNLRQGLTTGLSCLARINPERRLDAAGLLAILRNPRAPARIRCGHMRCKDERILSTCQGDQTGVDAKGQPIRLAPGSIAMAYRSVDPGFPALQLNLEATARNSATDGQGTLFHEMLHWLGYRHSEGMDVPYLAEICCIGGKKAACELLKKDDSEWRGGEYQLEFMRIMTENRRPGIALDAAWASASEGPEPRDAQGLAAAALLLGGMVEDPRMSPDQWRQRGQPLAGLALVRASMARHPLSRVYGTDTVMHSLVSIDYYPASDPRFAAPREAALGLGKVLGWVMTGNGHAFRRDWPALAEKMRRDCPKLSANEREQVNELWSEATLQIMDLRPKVADEVWETFDGLCR